MSFTNFKDIAIRQKQIIKIVHVATSATVQFPAFLTEYSDDYTVSWGEEQIFGRNDPIKQYKSTKRSIQLGFDVLSHSFENAKKNLEVMTKLTKMLYPVYSAPLNTAASSLGRTIKAPPLVRIHYTNFIQSAGGNGGGLLGCISGVNFSPNRDAGFFIGEDKELFPKHFNIKFSFDPQHEEPLGWESEESAFITENFPYSMKDPSDIDQSISEDATTRTAKQGKLLEGS